jgi:short-subunit dehydrogenase
MVYWIKAVLPAMRSQGRGWIVNLSSLAGRLGQPDEVAYSATKFAVTGFSEGLSYELDPLGIYVLCVYPALVRTEMFDERTLSRMPEQAKRTFLSVEEFCAAVLAALERGAYEVTVPQRYGFVYLIKLLLPGMFRRSMARMRLPLLPELTR